MKKYKKGQKFTVCGHDELKNNGWHIDSSGNHYSHDDFPECSISHYMIEQYEGDTLTVTEEDPARDDWYDVSEDTHGDYVWPVATFLSDEEDPFNHFCEEGVTPIGGWIICKTCGTDLKKLK